MTNQTHKLGVIVPYRDRPQQLQVFKRYISNYLYSRQIQHEIIIVEQDKDRPFNRGLLCNWGFRKAVWSNCDYVVFHDVDLIPQEVDYSFPEYPTHLVGKTSDKKVNDSLFYDYFGGATLFSVEDFKKINGFSNDYWGWGFEDDDLFLRCQEKGIKIDTLEWKQRRHAGVGLEFDGKTSYVNVDNPLRPNRNFSIFGSFTIDSLDCNLDYEFDEMSIFSFPGSDIALSYRSFMNFNFQLWDKHMSPHSIFTEKYPFGSYNFVCTFDIAGETKIVKLYINGDFIGQQELSTLVPFSKASRKSIYLGAGDPTREVKPNFFKGLINNFAIYNTVLNDKDISEVSNNTTYSLFEYTSSRNLTLYFDSKFIQNNRFIDLVGDAYSLIKNCNKVHTTEQSRKKVPVPFKRPGIFKAITHQNNGFTDSWQDWSSRTNQSKYFKILEKSKTNSKKDGLSEYWGELVEETTSQNYHHLYVKS